MTKYIDRKSLALMLEVSVDQIRKNEEKWGLLPAKQVVTARCVRYVWIIAEKALKERKLMN
jgi:hypothetical protein